MPRILVAEDEESLSNTLTLNLGLEGYQVTLARTGTEALELFLREPTVFNLALLDITLPGHNGLELCAKFREVNPRLPVIFLTARGHISDRREGLRTGADDYITKPFDLEELLLRIANLIKRTAIESSNDYRFDGGSVNFESFVAIDRQGLEHQLSRREIGLMKLLTANEGKVVSRDQILSDLWYEEENASSRTIDNFVLNFRKLFEENPRKPRHFHSVRGVGYRFTR